MNPDSSADQEEQGHFWSFDGQKDVLEIYRLEVPGNRNSLNVIRNSVEHAACATPLSEIGIAAFQMAVDEICANVVEHGYEKHQVQDESTLAIEIARFDDRIETIITDRSAIRFTVKNAPEPLSFLQEQRKRGLGLDIVRYCVDKVEYQWLLPHGNQTHLIKYYGEEQQA